MGNFRSYGNLTLAITAVLFFIMVPYLLSPICSRGGNSCSSVSLSRLSVAAKAFDAAPTEECLCGYGSMLVIGRFFALYSELPLGSSTSDYWKETITLRYVASLFSTTATHWRFFKRNRATHRMWLPRGTFDVSVGLLPYVYCSKFGSAVSIQVPVHPLLIVKPWMVTELPSNSYTVVKYISPCWNFLRVVFLNLITDF